MRIIDWIRSWFDRNPPQPPTPQPPSEDIEQMKQTLLSLHNQVRTSNRLPPFNRVPELDTSSQLHNDYMASNNNLTHNEGRRDVGDRVLEQGYKWLWVGENIAEGQQSPEEVMNSWMNSRGHRDNILNEHYTDIGFGITSDNTMWWTVDFGAKL